MEQFVINIGRQLGSGGRTVGEIIARRLGVKLYDKELINLAARESGICSEFFEKADEKESRGVISTVVGYLRAPYVIRAVAARESAVFVGRCADYILRENPRCVNVFLTADDADRIGRIRSRQGCTAEEARAMMERVDARRASYYNYYSSRTWGEAATYHLCVSTSPLGDEGTADFILEFAARKLNMKF